MGGGGALSQEKNQGGGANWISKTVGVEQAASLALSGQQSIDGFQKGFRLDRFRQIGRPELRCLLAMGFGLKRGEEHHRDRGCVRRRLDLAGHCQPVQVRQHDIGDHHVGRPHRVVNSSPSRPLLASRTTSPARHWRVTSYELRMRNGLTRAWSKTASPPVGSKGLPPPSGWCRQFACSELAEEASVLHEIVILCKAQEADAM